MDDDDKMKFYSNFVKKQNFNLRDPKSKQIVSEGINSFKHDLEEVKKEYKNQVICLMVSLNFKTCSI
jgi:hypothetical protein